MQLGRKGSPAMIYTALNWLQSYLEVLMAASTQTDGSAWMPAEKQGPFTPGAVGVFSHSLSI